MPVALEIIPIPLGSKLVKSIGSNDPDDLNDFRCLIVFQGNVTNLRKSGITVLAVDPNGVYTYNANDVSIVSLEGTNSVYEIVVRPPALRGRTVNPPENTANITVTVAANAVSEGNPQTSKSIRVSTNFPDADAKTPTLLFDTNKNRQAGIAVTPNRILTMRGKTIHKFTHSGREQTAEAVVLSAPSSGANSINPTSIDYFNGSVIVGSTVFNHGGRFDLVTSEEIVRYRFVSSATYQSIIATPLGIMILHGRDLHVLPFNAPIAGFNAPDPDSLVTHENVLDTSYTDIASEDNLLYLSLGSSRFGLAEIADADTIDFIKPLNISSSSRIDISIYRDTLYMLLSNGEIHTLDIRPYRPMAKRTKTTIPIQFANEGDTLDLTKFAPDAERIVFDIGYRKPPFLSINTNNGLVVSSSAVSETTPVFVQCLGINRIDSQPFSFYLVIRQASDPKWREIDTLSMRAGSSVNLFDYVDADSISFRSGRTQPLNSTLSNGIFTIDKTGGRVSFTARKGSRTTHTEFDVHVIQQPDPANFSDIFRHRVEIAGIDVTADVSEFPTVSKSLDDISLNEYRANQVSLTLKSGRSNNYKYNDDVDDNFWGTNGLNPAGFQVPIHIFIESLVNGEYVSHLLFAGTIIKATANLGQTRVELRCIDISTELENTLVQDFGTLQKWDTLRQKTDEISFQGIYAPESPLLPMQTHNAQAWGHLTKLTMRQLALPSEGQPIQDAAYLTPQELFTSGGFLPDPPILKFKTQPRSEDVRFLVNQIALNKKVYNVEMDLPAVSLSNPFILNRGSIPFSVENTRIIRLLTDWVYDPSNNRILMLLSNPEAHLADLFVEYRLNSDSYRILHTFDKDTAVHRIERRNGTHYYILTSAKITQDRSARQFPRTNDATGYTFDSLAEGSKIKIYHYSTSTGNLTEHVAEDDSFPPQLGIHYHVGFENQHYIDEFEGIRPDYRGAFKWHSNHLYYRYAKDGEFGVARVDSSGTTERLVHETKLALWNHLNFAFDVTRTGTVYMVHCWKIIENITVVERSLPNGTQQPLTISNDLSGVGPPIQLLVEVTVSRTDLRGDTRGTITGIDRNGNTVSENYGSSGGGNGAYRGISEHQYQTITSVTGGGSHAGANVKITSILGDITTLEVRRRTAAGVETPLFSEAQLLEDTTKHPSAESTVIGVHEAIFHNNSLYVLAIVATLKDNNGTLYIDRTKAAGMVLYRCNVTAASPSLTVIEKWDFVQLAGCNLTVHDGNVHYVEQPSAATAYKPINPDLDGYWADEEQTQTMGYNIVEESLGALKKISNSGEVDNLGNLWFEERPYSAALARCLSFNDELHIVMGYGDPQQLLRFNSLGSKADNYQHLVFGKKLHYVVPEFDTNGSRFALLSDLAKKTNATLSFREGLIRISDRSPFRAETDGQTGTGTGNLAFENANKEFPDTGYLFIGKEILKYTGISGSAFTNIERGVLGTEIVNHANDTPILYLDAVIEPHRLKSTPSIETDTNRIHNVIRNSENTTEETDSDSITAYNERPYSLDLGLTPHESPWQEHIFKDYLGNLKDPHPLIPLTLMPTNYLELEQFVAFRHADLVYAVQIVSITYTQKSTTIRGRVI